MDPSGDPVSSLGPAGLGVNSRAGIDRLWGLGRSRHLKRNRGAPSPPERKAYPHGRPVAAGACLQQALRRKRKRPNGKGTGCDELIAAVESGVVAVSTAGVLAGLPEQEQKAVVTRGAARAAIRR